MTTIPRKEGKVNKYKHITLKDFVDVLGGKITQNPNKAICHCPVHRDNKPSFSVTQKANGFYWNCHAGCQREVILDELIQLGLWFGKSSRSFSGKLTRPIRTTPKSQRPKQPTFLSEEIKRAIRKLRMKPVVNEQTGSIQIQKTNDIFKAVQAKYQEPLSFIDVRNVLLAYAKNINPKIPHIPFKEPPLDNIYNIFGRADEKHKAIVQYITSRGLLPYNPSRSIAFHPSIFHSGEDGYFPALISVMELETGLDEPFTQREISGLHITFLKGDNGTFRKAEISPSKRILSGSILTGSGVWISHPSKMKYALCLCEGIETGIALQQYFDSKNSGHIAVFACINANNLTNIRIPKQTKILLIASDKDRSGTGQKKAKQATKFYQKLYPELQISLALPPNEIPEGKGGIDWLDWAATHFKKAGGTDA